MSVRIKTTAVTHRENSRRAAPFWIGGALTVYEPDELRKSTSKREVAANEAKALMAKLEGYKL